MNSRDIYDPKEMDQYDYDDDAGFVRRFLWFCAGADGQLLRRCPHSERVKVEGIGGVVLATAILAFLSSSYAFYTVFGPKVGLALDQNQLAYDWAWGGVASLCGLIWGLIIFNLDRFIVTATGHGDGTSAITLSELANAIPRLIMAVVIGLSLSAPLEIRIFKTEIDAKMYDLQLTQAETNTKKAALLLEDAKVKLNEKISALNALRTSGQENLQQRIDQVRKAEVALDHEAQSGGKTGKRGIGPIYRKLESNLKQLQGVFASEKEQWETKREPKILGDIKALEAALVNAQVAYERSYSQEFKKAASLDGLGKRIELSHELFPTSSMVLMGLLIMIELAPVLIKMMLVTGPYDFLSENQNHLVAAKYAIEERMETKSEDGVLEIDSYMQFHQAELILSHEKGQLEVEKHLAQAAYAVFESRLRQHIEAHPEQYIADMPAQTDVDGKPV
ncbi:MAG: DUF4407 domain-containing protein [Mariprofundus sp.]|nr:DUF4407 domain-containing protein [Mariprofundus sp.]